MHVFVCHCPYSIHYSTNFMNGKTNSENNLHESQKDAGISYSWTGSYSCNSRSNENNMRSLNYEIVQTILKLVEACVLLRRPNYEHVERVYDFVQDTRWTCSCSCTSLIIRTLRSENETMSTSLKAYGTNF